MVYAACHGRSDRRCSSRFRSRLRDRIRGLLHGPVDPAFAASQPVRHVAGAFRAGSLSGVRPAFRPLRRGSGSGVRLPHSREVRPASSASAASIVPVGLPAFTASLRLPLSASSSALMPVLLWLPRRRSHAAYRSVAVAASRPSGLSAFVNRVRLHQSRPRDDGTPEVRDDARSHRSDSDECRDVAR